MHSQIRLSPSCGQVTPPAQGENAGKIQQRLVAPGQGDGLGREVRRVDARARLLDLGLSDDELAAKDTEIDSRMDRAVENALAADYPDPAQEAGTEFKG